MTHLPEIKQSFWNFVSILTGQVGSAFLGIVILSLTAGLLGPDRFGVLSLFLMVTGAAGMLFLNWPNAAIIRYGKEEFVSSGTIHKVVWARLLLLIPTFLVALALLLGYADRITTYIGMARNSFYLIVLYLAFAGLSEIIICLLQATDKMKLYGLLPFFSKVFTLLLLLLMTFKLVTVNIENIIWFNIGSFVVIIIAGLAVVKPQQLLPFSLAWPDLKKITKYSWSITLGAISSIIVGWIDLVFIRKYMAMSDVGVYSLSYKGFSFLLLINMSIINLTLPLMVALKTKGRSDLINRYLDDLVSVGVMLWSLSLVAVIPLATFFIPIVFGQNYGAAIIPFVILTIALAFNTIGSFYSSVTAAYDMVLGTVLISILVSVVNITGDILLIPKIGISGAAVATTLAIGLGNILYIPLLKGKPELSYSRRRYRVVFMISPLLLCLGASLFFTAWYGQALVSIAIIAASLYLLPRLGIIKTETLTLLEIIEMPVGVKSILRRILTVLVRKGIAC